MSGFRGVLAGDLLAAGAKLDNATACAQALMAAGWRAIHVAAWLDDAMALARSMATAQERETIVRDMAVAASGRCDEQVASTVCLTSPLNLPGASASGFFRVAA